MTFIVVKLINDRPVVFLFPGNHKVWFAKFLLLTDNRVHRLGPEGFSTVNQGMFTKMMIKGALLGRCVQTEKLADFSSVFIVVGDFDPGVLSLLSDSSVIPEQRRTIQSFRLSASRSFYPDPPVLFALMTFSGGNIVFGTALVTLLEAIAEVTLNNFTFKRFNALTTAAIVFNQITVTVDNAPEAVLMTTGRAGNRHWHGFGVRLWTAYFRAEQIIAITGKVHNQTIFLAFGQPKPATHNLLIKADRLRGAKDCNQINMGASKPVVNTETLTRYLIF